MCLGTNMQNLLLKYTQKPTTFQDLPFHLWSKPLSSVHLDYSISLLTGFSSSALTTYHLVSIHQPEWSHLDTSDYVTPFLELSEDLPSHRVTVLPMACKVLYPRFLVGVFLSITMIKERYCSLVGTTRVSNIPWNIHVSELYEFCSFNIF